MEARMRAAVRRLLPITEARQFLGGIGHTTIYELVNRGEIVKVNIGRRGFITSESLEAYVDRLSSISLGTATSHGESQKALSIDELARGALEDVSSTLIDRETPDDRQAVSDEESTPS
jgi:hypothetical protein